MWLLKVWHSITGSPVNSILQRFYILQFHNSFILQNATSYWQNCSNIYHISKIQESWVQHQSQTCHQQRYDVGFVNQRLKWKPLTSFQSPFMTTFSYSSKECVRILPFEHKHFEKTLTRCFHSSTRKQDIPDYLQGNISEVSSIEDDFDEDFEDELDNNMEEEILDFLDSHLLSYEETESSFIIPCCKCSVEDQASHPQEIFVDKNSGYFVCPWCCQAGTWEELTQMLNLREDSITAHQLSTYLSTTTSISEADFSIFQESPFKAVSLTTFEDCGAKLTNDGTRIVIPLKSESGSIVGFESVSLLYPVPKVVRRYVTGEVQPLFVVDILKNFQRICVVPTCCDVLTLAEYRIPAVSMPSNGIDALYDYLIATNKRGVYLWLGVEAPPRQLLQSFIQSQIPCWIIRCENKDSPIHCMSKKEVQDALKDITPILSDATTTFADLRDQIYHRLTNKEEACGIQWKRFSGLNDIVLGHRKGEMTVLTGPTGSGKTTLMAEYSLDLCSQGVVTLWGSFEVSVVRLCEIMLQQYRGTTLPVDLNDFNVLSSKFSSLPLHFLTYHGQQTSNSVLKAMTEAVRIWGVQHVIIDNLQFMLGMSERPVDRWWEQDKAVASFRRFATSNNCHVTLIVHPKKVPEGQLLSIDSIFGGAKVTQEADNVFILQVKDANVINQRKKALQVVKNRYGGQLGVLPLKFHQESLTLSNYFSQKHKPEKEKPSHKKGSSVKQVKGLTAFMN